MVTFPKTDFDTSEAKLTRCWRRSLAPIPATGMKRQMATMPSCREPGSVPHGSWLTVPASRTSRALPEEDYRSFFDKGEVSGELEAKLIARYKAKRAAGQWVPPLGEL